MVRHAVLTVIGADRPGLVDDVTRFIVDRDGNLEDSRMVNLHGQFAMMILVAGSEEAIARMRDELGELERASAVRAELIAGLLHAVSHLLRSVGANIESAQTSLQGAPMTGTPVFSVDLVVSVPAAASIAELRAALGRLCDEQNMDWRLTAL
jgi:glycine cleavage system transcriptional repressor